MEYVYFVLMKDKIKIGYTKNIKNRLKSLKTSSPYKLVLLGLIEGGKELEKQLHTKFKKYKNCGEWFSIDKENQLIDYINQNSVMDIYVAWDGDVLRTYRKMKL